MSTKWIRFLVNTALYITERIFLQNWVIWQFWIKIRFCSLSIYLPICFLHTKLVSKELRQLNYCNLINNDTLLLWHVHTVRSQLFPMRCTGNSPIIPINSKFTEGNSPIIPFYGKVTEVNSLIIFTYNEVNEVSSPIIPFYSKVTEINLPIIPNFIEVTEVNSPIIPFYSKLTDNSYLQWSHGN